MTQSATPFALQVSGLSLTYGGAPVLSNVDLALPQGVMAAIVGPNGAGKSSLLKSCLGLVRAGSGRVEVLGEPLERARRRIGYVPQRASVDWDFPTTVQDVVAMGLYGRQGLFRRAGRDSAERVAAALASVGMEDLARRQIGQLSGGQQQRVFIARALVQDADLYVLDEPMAGVDATTEARIIALLGALRDRGKTVLVVHHDLSTVRRWFDWLIMLNTRVIAQGPVEQIYTAQNLRAAYGGQLAILDPADQGLAGDPAPLAHQGLAG